MKKLLIQSIVILAINLIVGLLAAVSFWSFLFKGDVLMAAGPGIPALLGIILQPWYIVFVLLPGAGGLLGAPFWTTLVTVPVYHFLDKSGRLEGIKNSVRKMRSPKALIIVALCAGIFYARYVDLPPMHRGVPRTIRSEVIKRLNLATDQGRFYCIGAFIDSEWLWQTRLSQKDFDDLTAYLGMERVDLSKLPEQFEKMPPYWWHPVLNKGSQIYSTKDFPLKSRGPDGWHAFVAWNPATGLMHMWIKDNF